MDRTITWIPQVVEFTYRISSNTTRVSKYSLVNLSIQINRAGVSHRALVVDSVWSHVEFSSASVASDNHPAFNQVPNIQV